MRQFKTWKNNLEAESTKLTEERVVIQKVEFRNIDRLEKSIATMAYKVARPVTKGYAERKEVKPFGIGSSFEDLKTNAAISTVQRESVWHPYYETIIDEMDFKEKMIAAQEEKKLQNVGGTAITELQKQLQEHDEQIREQDNEKKRAEMGLAPKKRVFDLKAKQAALREKEEAEGEKKVIDPLSIKVRKFPNEVSENDLKDLFEMYGPVTRVKILTDPNGLSKGMGFVTFKNEESAKAVIEEGAIKYDFFELPVEASFMSASMQQRREQDRFRGDRDGGYQRRDGEGGRGGYGDREGGFRGGRDGERGRGGYGDRDRDGGRGGFRGRDGDREGGRGGFRGGDREGYQRREGGDTGFQRERRPENPDDFKITRRKD